MFFAAFSSRSWWAPQPSQRHCLSASVNRELRSPQLLQRFDVGAKRSILTSSRPCQSVLYSSCRRTSPKLASRTARLSPAFCRTLRPGFARVPRALALMPLTLRSSIAMAWLSRTMRIVVLWAWSLRQWVLRSLSRASLRFVCSRRREPRTRRASCWWRFFCCFLKRSVG